MPQTQSIAAKKEEALAISTLFFRINRISATKKGKKSKRQIETKVSEWDKLKACLLLLAPFLLRGSFPAPPHYYTLHACPGFTI